MKALLILYNEFRTFRTTVKTYNILNEIDCDVVVFTQKGNATKSEILELLPNSEIYMEDLDEYKNMKSNHISPSKHAFFKIKEYLNKVSGYDLVFVNRMDSTMFINNLTSFIKNFDKQKIYLNQEIVKSENDNMWFVPDHFYAGSEEVIKYFFKNFNDEIDTHSQTAHYLESLPFNCGIWEDGMYSIHLRPNMEDFINKNINENEFGNKIFNWLFVDKEHKILEWEWKN